MSMPCTIFCCDTCDYSRYNTLLWGDFAYSIAGRDVPMERELAWCLECRNFAPVESFTDLEKCVGELTACVLRIAPAYRTIRAYLASMLLPGRRARITAAVERAAALAARIELIRSRDLERCLNCGSTEWLAFEDVAGPVAPLPGQTHPTGFFHPGCGGEISVQGNSVRLAMSVRRHRYSADGLRIN